MLMFLATFVASVVAVLAVQAMDIECVKQPRRRVVRAAKPAAKDAYCDSSVAGALR